MRTRDILLQFSHDGLYRARWSREILAEWRRNLLALRPELEPSIDRQVELMDIGFPESVVEGFERLIPALDLPDPDDRHVLAAAIKCGAQHIVTENLRDFPEEVLAEFDIEPVTADEFLTRTFDLYTLESFTVLNGIRSRYANPAYTPAEFVLDLTAKGLPKLAARYAANRLDSD